MTALELAKYYFDLSNDSDFAKISELFNSSTTFCNAKNDFFLGRDDIMLMQRKHHGMYKQLHWHVDSVEETKPNIISFVFTFSGELLHGEPVSYKGEETLIIHEQKIQHIQVKLV